MTIARRHDVALAARIAALIADRYDFGGQARVPAGQSGGGRFTSGGGSYRAPARNITRQPGGVWSNQNPKRSAADKQAKAIAEINARLAKKAERKAARAAAPKQELLFKKAPAGKGYQLNKAVGGGTAVGIANKALVHAAAQKGLAEHAARVARKTTPPPAAAPHAVAPAAAALRTHAATAERLTPDITIRGRTPTKDEYAQHVEILKDAAAGRASKYLARDMSDTEHAAWGALHQHGLMHQNAAGQHRLTPKGQEYLSQRSAAPAAPAAAPHRAAGDKTEAHQSAEQRLARVQEQLDKANKTGYGAGNIRHYETEVNSLKLEVADHERAAASGTAYRPREPGRAGFGSIAPPPKPAAPKSATREQHEQNEQRLAAAKEQLARHNKYPAIEGPEHGERLQREVQGLVSTIKAGRAEHGDRSPGTLLNEKIAQRKAAEAAAKPPKRTQSEASKKKRAETVARKKAEQRAKLEEYFKAKT